MNQIASRDQILSLIAGRDVILSISGGKDSAAASLFLRELGIEHRRVFADTNWEDDRTYRYLDEVLEPMLGPIDRVRLCFLEKHDFEGPPRLVYGMEELVRKKGMFPSRKHRFCTSFLKVAPLTIYLAQFDDPLSVVGIRAEESADRAKYPEWEDLHVKLKPSEGGPLDWHGEVWRPLLTWTIDDVVAIHKRHGLPPNPLYVAGASRVGCWPCINVRKAELRLIAESDPARIDRIRALEARVLFDAKKRMAAKETTLADEGYMEPTFFQGATGRTKAGGKRGMWPIDTAVAWSKTSHGGKHLELFHDPNREGCTRWGMCEPT
jgi:3'-phosphoadenosine 5'-phosphosulfate sulfotransferase (PAPS reductase)/FAD synthetase